MNNNRIYFVMVGITSVIFLAALASSFSSLLSSLQPYPEPFYAFAQTQVPLIKEVHQLPSL
ncbi:MAG: hypothetical protein WBE34_17925 [Candidatus Nitrosopolaris sp.]